MLHSGGLMKITSLLSFIGPYRGNFRWCLESNAYVGKTTQKSKRDTHTIILALHQKVSNVIDLDISSVQFSHSVMSNSVIPWFAAHQASLSITNSRNFLKLMSIMSVMPSNHLILCCPLLLPPSLFPSFRVFSNEAGLHSRWPKDWSFSFGISPSGLKISCSCTYLRLSPSGQLHWTLTDPFHQGLISWGWNCWTTTLFQWKWSLGWEKKTLVLALV